MSLFSVLWEQWKGCRQGVIGEMTFSLGLGGWGECCHTEKVSKGSLERPAKSFQKMDGSKLELGTAWRQRLRVCIPRAKNIIWHMVGARQIFVEWINKGKKDRFLSWGGGCRTLGGATFGDSCASFLTLATQPRWLIKAECPLGRLRRKEAPKRWHHRSWGWESFKEEGMATPSCAAGRYSLSLLEQVLGRWHGSFLEGRLQRPVGWGMGGGREEEHMKADILSELGRWGEEREEVAWGGGRIQERLWFFFSSFFKGRRFMNLKKENEQKGEVIKQVGKQNKGDGFDWG